MFLGSVTLHHWQELAKPNLGGILDPRPGVLTKHFRQLDVDLEEVYNLNDLEEDDVDLGSFQALANSTPSRAKEHSNCEYRLGAEGHGLEMCPWLVGTRSWE